MTGFQSLSQFATFGPDFNIEAIRNGYFTVKNTITGKHRTFRVWKTTERDRYNTGAQIVSLFTGTQNTNTKHYKDFAFVNSKGCYSFLKLREQSPEWVAMCDMLHHLLSWGEESVYYRKRGYIIEPSERCYICGRTLTTPESIRTGVGPICAAK